MQSINMIPRRYDYGARGAMRKYNPSHDFIAAVSASKSTNFHRDGSPRKADVSLEWPL